MNPTHREFFIKLRALCEEYQNALWAEKDGSIGTVLGGTLYTIKTIGRFCDPYVVEHFQHRLEHEEPQP